MGSSVLDAMACGVPVVVSPIGGLPELMGRNERGLVIGELDAGSLASAIRLLLLRDASLRMRLAKAAQDFSSSHRVDEMASQYAKVYDAILSRQTRRMGWIDV